MPLWAVNIALEISVPERRYHSIQDWYARLIWISIPVNIIPASQTHATAWSPSWFIRTGHQIQFTESEYWSDLPLNPKDTWLRHYKFTFLTYVSWMPGVVAVLWSLDTHPCACYTDGHRKTKALLHCKWRSHSQVAVAAPLVKWNIPIP